MPDLDIPGVVRALNAHGVRYVVIGGVAALVHNLPLPATVDIDVTPSRDPKNLERLCHVLFRRKPAGRRTPRIRTRSTGNSGPFTQFRADGGHPCRRFSPQRVVNRHGEVLVDDGADPIVVGADHVGVGAHQVWMSCPSRSATSAGLTPDDSSTDAW